MALFSSQQPAENGTEGNTQPLSHEEPARERRTPSWFSQPLQAMDPDEAAERYRAMRGEVLRGQQKPESSRSSLLDREIKRSFGIEDEAPVSNSVQIRAPMAPRKVVAPRAIEDAQQQYELPDHRPQGAARKARARPAVATRGRLPLEYIAAGVAAVLAGGLLGYGATHYKAIGAKADEIASLVKPAEAPVAQAEAATVATTVLAKKSIATATLAVSDVSGELNSMIPLMLHAEPAEAGEDLILKLSGLPQSAYLTAGAKAKDNAWQLAAVDAADVKLVVPQTSEPSFDVAVAAFEADSGQLAAPIKEMTVAIDNPELQIAPAAALPESVMVKSAEQSQALAAAEPEPKEEQVAAIEPPAEAQNLLAKGDILLKSGDLEMARQFYERAFAEGSVEAAIGAGKTYDPVVYAELKVHGLKPDPARALEWYGRANAAGNAEAAAAINALKQAEP